MPLDRTHVGLASSRHAHVWGSHTGSSGATLRFQNDNRTASASCFRGLPGRRFTFPAMLSLRRRYCTCALFCFILRAARLS
jgi:hypothetical protein